jgi:hypothetical protein
MGSGESTGECAGKSMLYLPWIVRRMILKSMEKAEALKGSPASTPEMYVVAVQDYKFWETQGWIQGMNQNMYREDLFYCDKEMETYSLHMDGKGRAGSDWE